MIDRPQEYEKMDLAERELWWYQVLHEQTIQAIQQQFTTTSISILDAACGTGGLIQRLAEKGFSSVKGFDLSTDAVEKSRQKTKADIIQISLQDVANHYEKASFDVVICNDAFYFVEKEKMAATLSHLLLLLKKNGMLIINLPAMNMFRGMHDLSVGIDERWDFADFKKVVRDSNMYYTRIHHHYWPFLLSPLILTARLVQRIKLRLFPSSKITSDVAVPPKVLNNIFYNLTKGERYLPFKRWIGSSLFIVVYR